MAESIRVLGDPIDLLAGQTYFSEWLTVDQETINRFGEVTHDMQFIHVDPVRAAQTPFGGTIAHGFLLLSLLPHLHARSGRPALPKVAMGINYGFDRVRFVTPVRAGSEIRARFTVASIEHKGEGRYHQELDVEVVLKGSEKPALVARWLGQFVLAGEGAGRE